MVVCPPFTDLRTLQTLIDADKLRIQLGAQNCHWEDSGAYTGEVSPPMLAKLNVSYVIVGHSERRQLFGETDETVNLKLKAVLKHGMTPIVCVGETLDEREVGATADRVTQPDPRRVRGGEGEPTPPSCVVAYEPIWAIGTGRNATPEDANETIGVIRGALARPLRRRDRRRDPHPVRREREVGQHRRRSWRCPRSTAPSSAARRSIPTSSPGSSSTTGAERGRRG